MSQPENIPKHDEQRGHVLLFLMLVGDVDEDAETGFNFFRFPRKMKFSSEIRYGTNLERRCF